MTAAPDVIVAGSGPAGVSAAWPLVLAGLRVLMVDGSDAEEPAPPSREKWKQRFGADFAGLELDSDISPKLATPQAHAARENYDARLGLETRNFLAVGSLGRGGLSKIWGALAEPFLEDELARFPFAARELAASYSAVQRRIGVSGGAEADASVLTNPAARKLLERFRGRRGAGGLAMHPACNAVLLQDHDERAACNRCGECLYGCARGAIYDSALELPALRRFVNFAYAPDHFVRSVGEEGGRPFVDVETLGGRVRLSARATVLAAGCISTTALALRRIGHVGRPVRLLSNPAAAAAFLSPFRIGADRPEDSFSLGQLFFRLDTRAGRAAGVVYGANALPADLFAARLPFSRPLALRVARALAPALLVATCYAPGALSRNEVAAHAEGDRTRIAITGEQTVEGRAALDAALATLRGRFAALGVLPIPGSASFLPPGADVHYAGTLPMGGEGAAATSATGELANAPNLFVADGACLPDLPATHPTLTIMANADRIGREIARRFAANEIDARSAQPLTVAG
ncbi:MAG TPA: GMC oxidoreductase [Rhodoblastus sp.]|nr:GMC oxidoreductase [Rhodoblastus sp.]